MHKKNSWIKKINCLKKEEDPIKTQRGVRGRFLGSGSIFGAPPGKKLGSTSAQGPFGGPRNTGQ